MGKAAGACRTRSGGLARGEPSPRTEDAPFADRHSELGKRGSQTIWGFLGRGMAGPLAGIHRHRRGSSRAARRAGGYKLMGMAILVMFVMQGCLPVSESMPDTGGRMNPHRGDSGTRLQHEPARVGSGVLGSKSGTRLQRSRSESALMQLERKLSNSKLGDVDVSTSSLMLPGEKTMVWSDLFSYLSRPEMLQGVSPRQFKESDNQQTFEQKLVSKKKLVVVLVGLPARGKSYISHRLVNYLNWVGIRCKLFNVGAARRGNSEKKVAGEATDAASRADFFDKNNKSAAELREKLAEQVLDDLLEWLKSGQGNMAIFDATNTTKERRQKVLKKVLQQQGVEVVFVESICTDEKVVEANLAEKVRLSPDFQNMDFQSAVKDLKKRIANYEAVYESLDEDEKDPKGNSVSFIKVINLSSKVIANNIHGKIARSVLTFLMNLHIMQRPIFLVRGPHPDGATEQNWQIQGNEPTFPNVCTNVISEAVGAVADPDVGGQVGACKVPRIGFADERKSTLHICAEVSLHVMREGDITKNCSVSFQTVDGTALAGTHYNQAAGVVRFAENQTRAEIKLAVMDPHGDCISSEKTFFVILTRPTTGDKGGDWPEPGDEGAVLGKKIQCAVSIFNDDEGLPEKLRAEWSRLKFQDSGRLGKGLNEGGRKSAERLGRLLQQQVKEFYMSLHREKRNRLTLARDVVGIRISEQEDLIHTTLHRRTVIEEAIRLQNRIDGNVKMHHNFTTTIRVTGHLYNQHLLEKTLDILELGHASVRTVGEPALGGTKGTPSTVVLQLSGVMEKDHMSEIVQNIRDLFRDMDDTETDPEGHAQGVEVLEEAKDVGEMAKLVKKLNEATQRLDVLKEESLEADRAIEACDAMTEDQVLAKGRSEHPAQVFTSTLPITRETGEKLFADQEGQTGGVDEFHEDVTSLNPADIWATYGMTLADVYDSLGHEGARQFLHSPYTARLPGGEALKDVVRRLEPFVVDLLERQKAPVVVVSHLGTLQVLYQYFVGVGSDVPFWKLDIPRGSVIQLVPHLFGFEERRFSFKADAQAVQNEGGHTIHMTSHWG